MGTISSPTRPSLRGPGHVVQASSDRRRLLGRGSGRANRHRPGLLRALLPGPAPGAQSGAAVLLAAPPESAPRRAVGLGSGWFIPALSLSDVAVRFHPPLLVRRGRPPPAPMGWSGTQCMTRPSL